jgi:hypothetical protein
MNYAEKTKSNNSFYMLCKYAIINRKQKLLDWYEAAEYADSPRPWDTTEFSVCIYYHYTEKPFCFSSTNILKYKNFF